MKQVFQLGWLELLSHLTMHIQCRVHVDIGSVKALLQGFSQGPQNCIIQAILFIHKLRYCCFALFLVGTDLYVWDHQTRKNGEKAL